MTPRTIIETLEVEGEGFLGDISLTFSSGLNCIIGARGTGKTSILELIRYASGQDAGRLDSPSEVANVVSSALGDEGRVRICADAFRATSPHHERGDLPA